MRKILGGLLIAWALISPALADSTINGLGAGAPVSGSDIFPAYQGANPATGVTATQIKTFTGGGTVTNIATSCGVSGGAITTTGTIQSTAASAVQAGANYPFVTGDCGTIVYLNNAANQIPTIPQAGTTGFATGWYVEACNIGAGTQTITPATSTIGGAATYVLGAGSAANPKCVGINSDGSNYKLDLTGPYGPIGALGTITPGTGVATAAAVNLSAAGGLTTTIATGTAALGTSAISSATCATVVTVAATNVATTDVVLAGFNGDPTAVTGYIPATAGMLSIIPYPTSGNVNFKVCNNTSSSVTPGAITLNWRVAR